MNIESILDEIQYILLLQFLLSSAKNSNDPATHTHTDTQPDFIIIGNVSVIFCCIVAIFFIIICVTSDFLSETI